jgi:DNA-directed RNA polymerase specialized sigma24 family protein
MTSEADLISGCLLQDRIAQRQLYDRYKKAMYTLACRITGDFDDANDVLQDAFLVSCQLYCVG